MIFQVISVHTLYIKWCIQLNFNILNIDISNTMDKLEVPTTASTFTLSQIFRFLNTFFYRVWDSKIFIHLSGNYVIINGIIIKLMVVGCQKSRQSLIIGTNISKIYQYMYMTVIEEKFHEHQTSIFVLMKQNWSKITWK